MLDLNLFVVRPLSPASRTWTQSTMSLVISSTINNTRPCHRWQAHKSNLIRIEDFAVSGVQKLSIQDKELRIFNDFGLRCTETEPTTGSTRRSGNWWLWPEPHHLIFSGSFWHHDSLFLVLIFPILLSLVLLEEGWGNSPWHPCLVPLFLVCVMLDDTTSPFLALASWTTLCKMMS